MIVFINGAFGVGKTTVAKKLVQELPGALLFDAEEVGFMLRNVVGPVAWSGDFQDYPMWRSLTVEVARGLLKQYRGTLVMPMTIRREDYFQEVMTGLAGVDPCVYHFCLTAPAEVIGKRIYERGEQQDGDWIFQQIDKCVSAFESELFEEKIDSHECGADDIVSHILSRVRRGGVGQVCKPAGRA